MSVCVGDVLEMCLGLFEMCLGLLEMCCKVGMCGCGYDV